MYFSLPFHSMTVTFDEKHLIFWILGNAFYGTPGTRNRTRGRPTTSMARNRRGKTTIEVMRKIRSVMEQEMKIKCVKNVIRTKIKVKIGCI